jgi:hypothetical protein
MKKLLIATIALTLAFGASRLVIAEDEAAAPVDPNTPMADANAIAE